jgi:hypothetical protein
MAHVAVETLRTIVNCQWSRPGYRLSRVPDRDQPESPFVCVRTGVRTEVAEMGCERCPFWEPAPQML